MKEADDLLPAGEPIECEDHGRCDECGAPMCEHQEAPRADGSGTMVQLCPASALLVPDWTL